ncbi:MAG: phytanoyl-CoA dioxygenase family protein [Acidimicrobiia bacterium]|nr:phytanoyl-CoA dioxygenase family protein [Acidimicrobiia bacterium]
MGHEPLDGAAILEFYERGYIRPGRVFDDRELDELRGLIDEVTVREQEEGRLYDLLDPALWPDIDESTASTAPPANGRGHVEFLFNLWRVEPQVRKYVFDSRLACWAAQLIGTPAVRLLEDNALWKEPRSGGELKWHQDYPYWPLAQPNAVTAWVALDDTDAANGAMSVAVGSHLTGERLPAAFGTGTPYHQDRRPATVKSVEDPVMAGFEIETIALRAGEVSFHSSLVLHGSPPNTSDRLRRALVIRYVGDGTIWLGATRYEYNYTDDEVGLKMGDPIGGEYFPLIPI